MGEGRLSNTAYESVKKKATSGGKASATSQAEERIRQGRGLDPLVDPKGPAHLGPLRRSLPRFVKQGNLWLLTRGIPMSEETLLDTTGSMGDNVEKAFNALPKSYDMLTSGNRPVLGRYDVQIATSIFNDVEDNTRNGKPVLCRTQFEMDEKIALQMTNLVPGKGGFGNGKEDPQFGIFAAVYLTAASINNWGLKYYHFAISDEPLVETIALKWLKAIFGDDFLSAVKENGYDFDEKNIPDTAQTLKDLQKKAHRFFFQVSDRTDVRDQWSDLYGPDYVIRLPDGTANLHCVKACVIGLTEGVLDLTTAEDFLREHNTSAEDARKIVRAVAQIPLGEQMLCPNFDKIPVAGDLFREKTDLWPISENELALAKETQKIVLKGGPEWL